MEACGGAYTSATAEGEARQLAAPKPKNWGMSSSLVRCGAQGGGARIGSQGERGERMRSTATGMRRRRGFTLVEMMVVLTIIVMLVGIVSVNVVRFQARARTDGARIQLRQLQQALRLFYTDHGRYPTEAQGLEALVRRPDRPPVPSDYPEDGYLDSREVPRDPWGRPYLYVAPGRDGAPFEILTYGRDGRPGGTGEDAEISTRDL